TKQSTNSQPKPDLSYFQQKQKSRKPLRLLVFFWQGRQDSNPQPTVLECVESHIKHYHILPQPAIYLILSIRNNRTQSVKIIKIVNQ
ncbi:MAG: hypothetical protein MJA84_04545, partial [Firmicutes bacterium]|nr:hypothetical protein [Bacillota bacterium]